MNGRCDPPLHAWDWNGDDFFALCQCSEAIAERIIGDDGSWMVTNIDMKTTGTLDVSAIDPDACPVCATGAPWAADNVHPDVLCDDHAQMHALVQSHQQAGRKS